MITRAHVQPYIGQPVVVHTHDGAIHRGILQSVSNDGIYLRSMRGRPRLAEGKVAEVSPRVLGDLDVDGELAETFWPFFFLPWLALAAFYPWGPWW